MGRTSQILLLMLYAVGLAVGQILFKVASRAVADEHGLAKVLALFTNIPFYVSLILYGGLTILYIWLLTFVPLSKAYPFAAVSLVLTPLLAAVLFGETLSYPFFLGLILIAIGMLLVQI